MKTIHAYHTTYQVQNVTTQACHKVSESNVDKVRWILHRDIMDMNDAIEDLQAKIQHNRKQLRIIDHLQPTDREVEMWGNGAPNKGDV